MIGYTEFIRLYSLGIILYIQMKDVILDKNCNHHIVIGSN